MGVFQRNEGTVILIMGLLVGGFFPDGRPSIKRGELTGQLDDMPRKAFKPLSLIEKTFDKTEEGETLMLVRLYKWYQAQPD